MSEKRDVTMRRPHAGRRIARCAVALMLAGCNGGAGIVSVDGGARPDGGGRADAVVPSDVNIIKTPPTAPEMVTDMNGNVEDEAACLVACNADPTLASLSFCGTDHQTYDGCLWLCGLLPDVVDVFPGVCDDDGHPLAGGPPVADGREVCDWVELGDGTWRAIECARTLAATAPTQDQVSSGTPADIGMTTASTDTVQSVVDHRSRFRDSTGRSVVKDQGPIGTCTAFATTAAMESALSAATGAYTALSEMHLWLRYCAADTTAALGAAYTGIATEARAAMTTLPFDGGTRTLAYDANCLNTGLCTSLADECFDEVDARRPRPANALAAVAALDMNPTYQVTALQRLAIPSGGRVPSTMQLQRALSDGLDVVISVRQRGIDWSTDKCLVTGVNRLTDCPAGQSPRAAGGVIPMPSMPLRAGGAHAVLVVGYQMRTPAGSTTPELYFIIRNSWGPTWGDGGYGYLPARYVQENGLNPFFSLRVAVRGANMPTMECPMGQAQSPVDGMCHVTCADGALAPASGVCPPASPCGTGLVSVNGTCVRACAAMAVENRPLNPAMPMGARITTGSGCEPAGCTYRIAGVVPFTYTEHCEAPNCGLNMNGNCIDPNTM